MHLDGLVERADGSVLQYLTVSGAPPCDVSETLELYPHVIDLRLLGSHGDEYRIEGHTIEDSMANPFRSVGGTTETASIEGGEFVIVGEVPRRPRAPNARRPPRTSTRTPNSPASNSTARRGCSGRSARTNSPTGSGRG